MQVSIYLSLLLRIKLKKWRFFRTFRDLVGLVNLVYLKDIILYLFTAIFIYLMLGSFFFLLWLGFLTYGLWLGRYLNKNEGLLDGWMLLILMLFFNDRVLLGFILPILFDNLHHSALTHFFVELLDYGWWFVLSSLVIVACIRSIVALSWIGASMVLPRICRFLGLRLHAENWSSTSRTNILFKMGNIFDECIRTDTICWVSKRNQYLLTVFILLFLSWLVLLRKILLLGLY